jgi:hydroxyacylglutathione hydrolase
MIVALEPAAAQTALATGAVPLDLRGPGDFAAGHVPGAVNVVFSQQHLGERVATVLPPSAAEPRLVLVGPDDPVAPEIWASIAADLVRVGFPEPAGYLDGGTAAWEATGQPIATLPLVSNADLAATQPRPAVLDVREPVEWETGFIANAHRVPLGDLPALLTHGPLPGLDPAASVAVICGSGVRSSSAASLLRRHGYARVSNLVEGMRGWYNQRRPVVID